MTTKCTRCQLHEHCHTNCMSGSGNIKAKIVLVGEAPGYEEDREGKPFVGPSGKLLRHIITCLGVDSESLWYTNVLRCRPQNNELPNVKTVLACWEECKVYLTKELGKIKPKATVLLGGTALKCVVGLDGITKHEGMLVGKNMVAAYHPAFVLRSPGKEVRLAQALHRAFTMAGISTNLQVESIYPYEIRS